MQNTLKLVRKGFGFWAVQDAQGNTVADDITRQEAEAMVLVNAVPNA